MATSGDQETTIAGGSGDAIVEAAARSVEQAAGPAASGQVVTPAGAMFSSNTDEAVVSDPDEPTAVLPSIPPVSSSEAPLAGMGEDQPTAVHGAIPPLLTDVESTPVAEPSPAAKSSHAEPSPLASEPSPIAAEPAQSAESAPGAEATGSARERVAEGAAHAREKGSEAADQAKEKTSRARKRLSAAAADARGRASNAASDARERASNTDVKEFAHSTTSLIDTARPFFLAGCAAIFAVLAFLEGDAGTAQVFAIGALLFVIGAAFSGEINAYLGSRSYPRDRPVRKNDD